MKYRIWFEHQSKILEHHAIPKDFASLECIPNVGDTVEFKCHEHMQDGVTDIGYFKVGSRQFSYGYAGADTICDITIILV